MATKAKDPLHNKSFITFNDDAQKDPKWQGEIIAVLAPGKYLCKLYDWLFGFEDSQTILTTDSFLNARLFDCHEDRNYWLECWQKRQGANK
jgi:hypothetical protein